VAKQKGRSKLTDSSDKEDSKEYYKGIIRHQKKEITMLKREVSRLTKYLINANHEYRLDEEDLPVIVAPPKEDEWKCSKCGSKDKFDYTFTRLDRTVQYVTCKECGLKERSVVSV
jgi:DNA-directed RNA polymerase subunit RPC12/RpoP